ncbi:hypothetical protein LTR10_005692 [Elasticomyces elasticus]|nr:hypothetical protein LTR10_005692 [Elasticomyces elasticus]KAK4976430.1 hypothetical protein LTR42_004059 [Elasticomyces elasticus]
MEPVKHRNIAAMHSVVATVTRFGNAISAAAAVFLSTMGATDEVREKSNAGQTTKKRKRTTQFDEETMAYGESPPPGKKVRIYERGATKQRRNGAASSKTAARARNSDAKSKIKFSNATNSSKGTAVIFGPGNPTFSGNETLHLNAELTFNNLLNESPTPATGRAHAYKPFDFDPITNPSGVKPRESTHYDDQGLVYVLNTAHNTTQTWFSKSLLRKYNGFDIRYHIKQHSCVGNPAIVRDDDGGLWYLAYGGVQALWGAKGGIVVGPSGNANLKHHDPQHSTYINKELVKHDPLRNGKYVDRAPLMLIKSPRPPQKRYVAGSGAEARELVHGIQASLFTPFLDSARTEVRGRGAPLRVTQKA